MMRFTETDAHSEIVRVIQETTEKHGIRAMRADHKEYHDDTFPNIKTYMHGCGFGIAIFERIEQEEFNPNVGLVLVSQIRRRKASGPAGHISLGGWVVSGCVPREFSAEPPITRCD